MTLKSLEDFVESAGGGDRLRVEHDFGGGFVRLRTSEAERRQAAQDIRSTEGIVLELLRNSRDAHATHIFVAMSRDGHDRILTVIDDGDGIPESMHEHVFEPRVTSKLDSSHMDAWGMHGRGMALYSVSANAEDAHVADSAIGMGCSMYVRTNTRKLQERFDQSTFPTFEMGENGVVNVRGPRNILRFTCEFAIDARDACAVYIGSPVEIAAALYFYGKSTLSVIDRAFCQDLHELPLVKRLAAVADPSDFAQVAESLGLAVSSRSARRIIDGQIDAAEQILARIAITDATSRATGGGKPRRKSAGARNLHLTSEDSSKLAEAMKAAWADLASRYYLDDSVEPSIRVSAEKLTISIPLVRKD